MSTTEEKELNVTCKECSEGLARKNGIHYISGRPYSVCFAWQTAPDRPKQRRVNTTGDTK